MVVSNKWEVPHRFDGLEWNIQSTWMRFRGSTISGNLYIGNFIIPTDVFYFSDELVYHQPNGLGPSWIALRPTGSLFDEGATEVKPQAPLNGGRWAGFGCRCHGILGKEGN